jgi:hypothetical protein
MAEPDSYTPAVSDGDGFTSAAAGRLRAAQAALIDVLASAGVGGARPIDLGRQLGLDKTLAWRVARFVEESDPLRAARHFPGGGGVEIVLRAAEEHGVEADRVEAVRHADRALRDFVRQHAGDRRSFEAMLARGPRGGGRDPRVESDERRELFRAGSVVWGVRAQAQVLALVLRPSPSVGGMLDVLQVGGLVGLERLRPDLPWIVRRFRVSDDAEREGQSVRRAPLDPDNVTPGGMPLIPQFCSRPIPELRRFQGPDGWAYDELIPGPVGRERLVTCVSGERYAAAVPFRWSAENTAGTYRLIVRTPVQHVLFDLYLHESLSHWGEATVRIDSLLEDRPRSEMSAGNSAPVLAPTPAVRLGTPPRVQSPRYTDHANVVRWAIDRAGWESLDHFRGYRADFDYPPPPCEFEMTCPIAPPDR